MWTKQMLFSHFFAFNFLHAWHLFKWRREMKLKGSKCPKHENNIELFHDITTNTLSARAVFKTAEEAKIM